MALQGFLHAHKLVDGGAVVVGEFAGCRHLAAKIFVGEHQCAVYEVAKYCHQLVVVASLEVLPCEIVVLGFRSIGSEHIAQHVLLAGEVVEIFVQPHSPIARSGNLVALEVEELVAWHVVGQDERAFSLEHSREHDAVEHYVILANKVNQAGRRVFPPSFPSVRQQFLGVADVADRGIEPHIQHLSLGALNRHRNSPIEVAGHGARLQTVVEPALALPIYVRTPLLVVLENPLLKPLLMLVERQIPVGGGFLHQRIAGEHILWVDEFLGREGAATLLALVAVSALSMASRTFSYDVTVGDKRFCLLVVVLLAFLLHKLAILVEFFEEIACHLAMSCRSGARVDVE